METRRTYLEERFGRERVCECEERQIVRVDFFPQVERDAVGVLVSAQGPDLLLFFLRRRSVNGCTRRHGGVGPLTPMNHSLQEGTRV